MDNRIELFSVEFVSFIPDTLVSGVLYICIEARLVAHLCPCGCGETVFTPLHPTEGWKLTYDGQSVSLSPSIGNFQQACCSHYYIINNCVKWCGNFQPKRKNKKKKKSHKKLFLHTRLHRTLTSSWSEAKI
jgi:hypothetical protein